MRACECVCLWACVCVCVLVFFFPLPGIQSGFRKNPPGKNLTLPSPYQNAIIWTAMSMVRHACTDEMYFKEMFRLKLAKNLLPLLLLFLRFLILKTLPMTRLVKISIGHGNIRWMFSIGIHRVAHWRRRARRGARCKEIFSANHSMGLG